MDGWQPSDFRILAVEAQDWLCTLLNLIEVTGRWPSELTKARAVSLAKTEVPDMHDVTNYRVLLMLPAVYLLWARVRLKKVEPWIDGWKSPHMYAGMKGRGAEQAWFGLSLEIEKANVEDLPTNLAIIDLSKAFDHIPRQLLYRILRRGGFPTRFLAAYSAFQDNLEVAHTVGEHVGRMHTRARSIPQGDHGACWQLPT